MSAAIAQVNSSPGLGRITYDKGNEDTNVFDDSAGQAQRKYYGECGNRRQINDEALISDINWPDNIQDSIDLLNSSFLATFVLYVVAMGSLHHKDFRC
ncbi:hypothetical protein HG530_014526 [Fusarium avenaceum]|nr:hypothetical protein HG530_014526 [Fusarium avenaceum]